MAENNIEDYRCWRRVCERERLTHVCVTRARLLTAPSLSMLPVRLTHRWRPYRVFSISTSILCVAETEPSTVRRLSASGPGVSTGATPDTMSSLTHQLSPAWADHPDGVSLYVGYGNSKDSFKKSISIRLCIPWLSYALGSSKRLNKKYVLAESIGIWISLLNHG